LKAGRGGGGGGPKKIGVGKLGGDSTSDDPSSDDPSSDDPISDDPSSGDSMYSYEGDIDTFPFCTVCPTCPKWFGAGAGVAKVAAVGREGVSRYEAVREMFPLL
jgi:hypothetical protein